MARESHIFTVPSTGLRPGVAKADVEAEIDWRIPAFEAGPHLFAFDGAALLLLELWRRDRSA